MVKSNLQKERDYLASLSRKAEKPAWDEVLSVVKDFEISFNDFKKDVQSKSFKEVEKWLLTLKEDIMFVIKEIKARKKELIKTGGDY